MSKLYRIVNDTFGKYRVESRGFNDDLWVPVKDYTDFPTFAEARQVVRNLAIRDEHIATFEPER